MKKDTLQIRVISLLMVIIPLLFICYFFIYENIQQRKAAEIDKNLMIVKSTAMVVEHEISDMLNLMKKTSGMSAFKELDKAGMRDMIGLFHLEINEFIIKDREGNNILIFYQGQYNNSINTKSGNVYKEVLQGESLIRGEHESRLSGEYVVGLNVPIFDDSGKVIAMMEAHLKNSFFAKYLDPINIGKTGSLSLVDQSGYYIYDKDIDNRNELVASQCYKDVKGKDFAIIERSSKKSGVMKIFTTVRLKELGWYLVGSQPSFELAATGIIAVKRNVLTSGLMLLTLLLLWRYSVSLQSRKMLLERQNAEKLALVGELAAGMAHEIRNPLTAIKGFSDLLKSKEKYRDDREIFELLASSVDHIEGIVRETLLLARPQKMEIGKIDLEELMNDTCTFMNNEALLQEIKLECNKGDKKLFAKGDRLHLKQVLINIVKNALEATPKGGKVAVKLEKIDSMTAKITVSDTGVGIKPELIDRVGIPFFTTKAEGTGLGLSVCRRVIEEHNGTIKISSTLGKGTNIEIYLPLVDASALTS